MKLHPLLLYFLNLATVYGSTNCIDILVCGDATSERKHNLAADLSEIIVDSNGIPARRLLPDSRNWRGGKMSMTMTVDPDKQNYITARFHGSEVTCNRLVLFYDNKQIGYHHLGDHEVFDIGNAAPFRPGQYYYITSPIPLSITKGKEQLRLDLRSTGPIDHTAREFHEITLPMRGPSRGIYGIYIHTGAAFVPKLDALQERRKASVRAEPISNAGYVDRIVSRVNSDIHAILSKNVPPGIEEMYLLAHAYHVRWTPAFQNPKVIALIVDGGDQLYKTFLAGRDMPKTPPGGSKPEWYGLGYAGGAFFLLKDVISPLLDKPLNNGEGGQISRGDAWAAVLSERRDLHIKHRRQYTNQALVNDLYGIYLTNRGIAAISSGKALPEEKARRYLYEALGLQPWSGSRLIDGLRVPYGREFRQLTEKGLSRELGYVGEYGEILDWITHMYYATAEPGSNEGDPLIRDQLTKALRARSFFRYPHVDDDGFRTMRLQTCIGWRDFRYPGNVTYGSASEWDGSALYHAVASLDPNAVGYAQQMMEDNQFFRAVEDLFFMQHPTVTRTLMRIPEELEILKKQPPSKCRLPMSEGQPDCVFTDEENGVVAFKHGNDIFYASLYWRARTGINFLARVHYISGNFECVSTVMQEIEFTPQRKNYIRPNRTIFGYGDGDPSLPFVLESVHTGERNPVASIPKDVDFDPRRETIYSGKGEFYVLRYGNYVIAMNCSNDKEFNITPFASEQHIKELVSDTLVNCEMPVTVAPSSTKVFYRASPANRPRRLP